MKLTILGCLSAAPNKSSFPSAQILEIRGSSFLIDCGEGTQIQLRRCSVKLNSIEHIKGLQKEFGRIINEYVKNENITDGNSDKMFHLKIKGCRWPFGDPGTDEFHFCGATQEIGKPYCLDHCMLAYRKKEIK